MRCYIKLNSNRYLYFDYEENKFCCGQSLIGDININRFTDKELNNLKSSSTSKSYDSFDQFLEANCIGDYNDSTITSVICTMDEDGSIYTQLLDLGFTSISNFVNCKTGNTVHNLEYIIDHGYTFEDTEEDDY